MEAELIDEFQLEGPETTSDISYKFIEMSSDLQFIEKPIGIEDFRDSMNQRNLDLEFKILRRLTESQMHAQCLKEFNPELTKLNRYQNIIPFRHSIVELPGKDLEVKNEYESYINANYISGSRKTEVKGFIATQGPVEFSKGHFWRMVWNKNISVIIMLCSLKENGKAQCDNYWVDKTGKKSLEVDSLSVEILEEKALGKEVFRRTFKLESTNSDGSSEARMITHYQWLGWPDHGIPKDEDFDSIENLLTILHEEKKKVIDAPIIVHCSAGIGRTGTLLSIYNLDLIMRESLKKKGDGKKIRLSVFGVVRRLREQRWGMVTSKEQYSFIYKYLANKIDNYLKNVETS